MRRPSRKSRRTYRRNPSRTVADPHGARELALCYDNERAVQGQKESIINNLARKMAKGQYEKSKAVKLWSYAAKAGADMYAKQFGSPGDTGSSMFNAATRMKASEILENENRDYVKERSERFAPKAKAKRTKTNPSKVGSNAYLVLAKRIVSGLHKYPFDVGGLVTIYGIPREKASRIMASSKSLASVYRVLIGKKIPSKR